MSSSFWKTTPNRTTDWSSRSHYKLLLLHIVDKASDFVHGSPKVILVLVQIFVYSSQAVRFCYKVAADIFDIFKDHSFYEYLFLFLIRSIIWHLTCWNLILLAQLPKRCMIFWPFCVFKLMVTCTVVRKLRYVKISVFWVRWLILGHPFISILLHSSEVKFWIPYSEIQRRHWTLNFTVYLNL